MGVLYCTQGHHAWYLDLSPFSFPVGVTVGSRMLQKGGGDGGGQMESALKMQDDSGMV